MLTSIRDYVASEILPRKRKVVFGSDVLMAVTAAVLIGSYGSDTPLRSLIAGDFVGTFLAYGAIAMGFCLGGMTLVLTIPNERFTSLLAKAKTDQGNGPSAYSDLLFVFSWTAIWHWIAICVGLVAAIALGWTSAILPMNASVTHKVVVGVVAFAMIYSLAEFLVTLITLSQVGRQYITHILERGPSD